MCCLVFGMVYIKEPLLLIEKSIPYIDGSGPLPYGRRHKIVLENVLSASLNKNFPFFLVL